MKPRTPAGGKSSWTGGPVRPGPLAGRAPVGSIAVLAVLLAALPGGPPVAAEVVKEGSVVYPFTVGGEIYIPAARPELEPSEPARLCLVAYNLGQGALEPGDYTLRVTLREQGSTLMATSSVPFTVAD